MLVSKRTLQDLMACGLPTLGQMWLEVGPCLFLVPQSVTSDPGIWVGDPSTVPSPPAWPVTHLLPPLPPSELKKQVESAELKNQRLKEVFQTKIQEFRKVCYALTGYQIDVTTESQYWLTSMYAEHKADCLIFKVGPSWQPAAHGGGQVMSPLHDLFQPDSLRKAG